MWPVRSWFREPNGHGTNTALHSGVSRWLWILDGQPSKPFQTIVLQSRISRGMKGGSLEVYYIYFYFGLYPNSNEPLGLNRKKP